MPSRRSQPLPKNWEVTRRRILRRDHWICYVCGKGGATEVDHVVPASQGGGDEDGNLKAIHAAPCHARKTALEGVKANPMAKTRKRKQEPHPGDRGGG